MKETLVKAKQALFKQHQPQLAIELLEPIIKKHTKYTRDIGLQAVEIAALAELTQKNYKKAVGLFEQANNNYMAGYCYILSGNPQAAMPYWQNLLHTHPFHWSRVLMGMLTGQLNNLPTFLQVRNFLESTLADLMYHNQDTYVKQLLLYADFLVQINLEAYKFFGRSLLNNGGDKTLALNYFIKSQQLLPNDPEIYFHLGQAQIALENPEAAKTVLQQCLQINPHYTPAKNLLNRLTAQGAS